MGHSFTSPHTVKVCLTGDERCGCWMDVLFAVVFGVVGASWCCVGVWLCVLLFWRIEAALWNVGRSVVFCIWVVEFGDCVAKLLVMISP